MTMKQFKQTTLFLTVLLMLGSTNVYAKKTNKGVKLASFPSNPSVENLYIKEKTKKVKKVDSICVGGFATSFIQNTVTQVRLRAKGRKTRQAAGRRLINVEKATRQAITDEAYAYSRQALADKGFTVMSEVDCQALDKWNKLKVSDKGDGELRKLGIFSGTLAIPTGATHASRHSPSGRPDYLSFGVSPIGDTGNNMVKGVKLAKKNNIGLIDFSFAMDFNINTASVDIDKSIKDIGAYKETTWTVTYEFDFTDALFVSTSGANYVNPKFKSATWNTGPQYNSTFPAIRDTSYITGAEKNKIRWDKKINTVNFDLSIDQEKYKEIYLKTLKAYIDVYVARMATLPSL